MAGFGATAEVCTSGEARTEAMGAAGTLEAPALCGRAATVGAWAAGAWVGGWLICTAQALKRMAVVAELTTATSAVLRNARTEKALPECEKRSRVRKGRDRLVFAASVLLLDLAVLAFDGALRRARTTVLPVFARLL